MTERDETCLGLVGMSFERARHGRGRCDGGTRGVTAIFLSGTAGRCAPYNRTVTTDAPLPMHFPTVALIGRYQASGLETMLGEAGRTVLIEADMACNTGAPGFDAAT